jgi:hypothetical protein
VGFFFFFFGGGGGGGWWWWSWIAHCISTVQFLVLVNGIPTDFLSSSRGLTLGDPMFLMLFVIVMKALGRMISMEMSLGLLSTFSV